MPTLDEFAAMRVLPVLAVRCPGRDEQYHVVTSGMTIGRATYNAVVVDHCDVLREHLIVHEYGKGQFRVDVVDDRFVMQICPYGGEVKRLSLEGGAEFRLGEARFRFLYVEVRIVVDRPITFDSAGTTGSKPGEAAKLREGAPAVAALPDLRVACPRCHAMLLEMPAAAKFCPRCGLELPAFCPPWTAGGAASSTNPAVVAYAHALFNLGMRYETVSGGSNLAQAFRYFDKAARMGVPGAKARLELREATH